MFVIVMSFLLVYIFFCFLDVLFLSPLQGPKSTEKNVCCVSCVTMKKSKIEKNFSCSSSWLNSAGIQRFSHGDIKNSRGNVCIFYYVLKNLTTMETKVCICNSGLMIEHTTSREHSTGTSGVFLFACFLAE